jgi:type IV pilus assembly protein PilA
MQPYKPQAGFTLIELMIVVAIIAILAAIALPAYQDYVIRSQVSEGAVLADTAKDGVWNYVANNGRMPGDNADAGIPKPASIVGKFVGQIEVTNGLVTITYSSTGAQRANSAINNRTLVLSPMFSGGSGSVVWKCQPTLGTVEQKYLPTICRSGSN